jgi:uncharacterized protein YbjT (DUF2867 family)
VVFGATGRQGGAVLRALRDTGRWRVRAVTRRPSSEAARPLRGANVEVVQGDLDDPDLASAVLPGADAMFVVTNYWEPQRDSEFVQGRRIIEGAIAAGMENIVYSTLPGVRAISDGDLSVPHCDGKYELEAYLRAREAPVAFVQPGWYFQNWLAMPHFQLSRDEEGVLTFSNTVGEGCIPGVDVDDLGPVVAAMLGDPARFRGRTIPVIAELRTSAEYADMFSRGLGEPVRYLPIPAEVLSANGPPGSDVAGMFEFFRRYSRRQWAKRVIDPDLPPLRPFPAWVGTNRDRFHGLLGNHAAIHPESATPPGNPSKETA